MGAPPQSLLDSLKPPNMKETLLITKMLEHQRPKVRQTNIKRRLITMNTMMKRRANLRRRRQGNSKRSCRTNHGIERRVRTLKRLIPNNRESNKGLEGLFRDTAAYIMSLQMKVRLMQVMVHVLDASDDQHLHQ